MMGLSRAHLSLIKYDERRGHGDLAGQENTRAQQQKIAYMSMLKNVSVRRQLTGFQEALV